VNLAAVTRLVVLVAVALVGLWAALVVVLDPAASVSGFVRDAATEAPIIAFALGVLIGHWFFPMERRP
jgi:hypothetical protein